MTRLIEFLQKNKFVYQSLKSLHDFYWKIIIRNWTSYPKNTGIERTNEQFTIGIVTYVARYESFFKPLIVNLVSLFPDTEFVIAINGYYDPKVQHTYLNEIRSFLAGFRNVKVVDFETPQSLSKLWNLLVINSKTKKTLILNDDIMISTSFRKDFERTGISNEELVLINGSWSHFLISKKIISQVGWFDERFPGVGNEDEDYECRLVLNTVSAQTRRINAVKNIRLMTSDFSYGKNIDTVNTKYVKENKLFFDRKWESSKTPLPGYQYVKLISHYVKLKDGMDTPAFYDGEVWNNSNNGIVK